MPLLPELQEILDREALNQKGGTRGKGGHAPTQRRVQGRWCRPNQPSRNDFRENSLPLLEPGCFILLVRTQEFGLGLNR